MSNETVLASNFLVPNATFIAELVAFLVLLWVLKRYVVPPISKAMTERQETIRRQFEDAEAAKERLELAEREYQQALAETRKEATRLREEAQSERAQIIEEARAEATRRAEEILEANRDRLATERQQILMSLRNEIGELAFSLSERIVHESLRDDARQRKLVEDFISGVGTTVRTEASEGLETAGRERA